MTLDLRRAPGILSDGGASSGDDPVARLLADYRPPAGVADELLDPQGKIRPVWRPFIDHLARLDARRSSPAASPAATSICATPASSTASTAPTGASERAWPLAHIPVLIEEDGGRAHRRAA